MAAGTQARFQAEIQYQTINPCSVERLQAMSKPRTTSTGSLSSPARLHKLLSVLECICCPSKPDSLA